MIFIISVNESPNMNFIALFNRNINVFIGELPAVGNVPLATYMAFITVE
jgi:hypothetical protein